ncbi:hypothetical protein [Rhodoblastus sp.]|nr:hypothetical protein [Rhodoblastus sp.]
MTSFDRRWRWKGVYSAKAEAELNRLQGAPGGAARRLPINPYPRAA